MADHFIHIYLAEPFGLQVEWKCEADRDADCKSWCPAPECEDGGCVDYERHREHWQRHDSEECGALVWLEEGGTWDEMYEGPDADVHSGPIILSWEGDGYSWRYAGGEER